MRRKLSLLAGAVAGIAIASSTPALAQSAWQAYERGAPVTTTAPGPVAQVATSQARIVEGPLVDGIVAPSTVRYVPLERPHRTHARGWGYDRSTYAPRYGRERYEGVRRVVPSSVDTTTSTVVLSNGTIVTSERRSHGGPTPPNTFGIEGLLPTPPSDLRISRGWY